MLLVKSDGEQVEGLLQVLKIAIKVEVYSNLIECMLMIGATTTMLYLTI